ncbi:AraC family transcriptional regulator [Janthinobacterium agaricidamnosum]|uniref:Bacterial regulatory helix-turn-helix s, AraC family protein n=1 Tax=Janthinobacterium agaricidamnosum NBRC 102515 = DSM 9628 TaxID=1349767 RepID=W0UY19_9BURK|nr:AraC family transcriptional regulator [Janthinobacterium agaricidamnosum]CDG81444.1 bacterial regulatory helix-turn-helix s, AraC family protein [Janthinobacterium agaricidamnosum NBRC 102515 = DSM 9628]
MSADKDKLANWLLGSIELDTAVFHVGQYCGRWRASTAGQALGSFHLVLQGGCYLHVQDQAPIALGARDGVFLLRDIPHFLSPHSDRDAAIAPQAMQPLDAQVDNGTGLACGFFQFRGALSALIVDSFPDYLIIRADTPALSAAGTLFDLILAEAGGDPEQPSPLIGRLVELLFFYLVRHVSRQEQIATGLAALLHRTEFTPLLDRMLQAPADDWSIDSMAKVAHMSRASFCKHFADVSGHPPAQFLLLLRMKIATQRLHAGDSVERTAEHVGYRSHAAFTRAFKRVTGAQPGAYRREQRQRQLLN